MCSSDLDANRPTNIVYSGDFLSANLSSPALTKVGSSDIVIAKMSTPERLDAMQAQRERHRAEREAAMKTRNQAVKTFYATLEPDQKKVFDALSMRWMGAMMRGGQGRPHAHDAEHDMQGHHRG